MSPSHPATCLRLLAAIALFFGNTSLLLADTLIAFTSGNSFYSLNLTNGSERLLTRSPFAGSANALALNAELGIAYYGDGTTLYYWDLTEGVGAGAHHVLDDLSSAPLVVAASNLGSTGGAYIDNVYYVGSENANGSINEIFAFTLSNDGKSIVSANALNILAACNCTANELGGFGDIAIVNEGAAGTLYGASTDLFGGPGNPAGRWKYDIASGVWTHITGGAGAQMAADDAGNIFTNIGRDVRIMDKVTGTTSTQTLATTTVDFFDMSKAYSFDFSDEPNSYGAAMHVVPQGNNSINYLGTIPPDNEGYALNASTGAVDGSGDDSSRSDDEDAVNAVPVLYSNASNYTVSVTCNGNGTVAGWLDYNQNGRYDNAERNSNHPQSCSGGSAVLRWTSVSGLSVGTTYARFRSSSNRAAASVPTGIAPDGEVEGFAIAVTEAPVSTCAAGENSIVYTSTDVPKSIGPNRNTITNSVINVPDDMQVTDVNVLDVQGLHTYMGDLRFSLRHNGTSQNLYGYSCRSQNNFSFSFDDQSTTVPGCPPTDGGVHNPTGNLSAFNNQSALGTWTLRIRDRYNGDAGTLNNWALEICTTPQLDYGDAPDTTAGTGAADYQTLNVNGGPYHQVSSQLRLGTLASADTDGFVDGTDDNGQASDDSDDGITAFPPLLSNATSYTLPATAVSIRNTSTTAATLFGFIDFNADGDFSDPGETASVSVNPNAVNPATDLQWSGLSVFGATQISTVDPVYARFRISANAALDANGFGGAGEVEDYLVPVTVSGLAVSGYVIDDRNVNAQLDGTDDGLPGITVVLQNLGDGSCSSVATLGDGSYQFNNLNPGNYSLFESAVARTPVPQICPPGAADPVNHVSVNANTLPVSVVDSDLPGLNFYDVRLPVLTTDNTATTEPASTLALSHRFTAYADGVLSLSLSNINNNNPAWSSILFRDNNCDAELGGLDTPLTAPLALQADESVCLLVKVFAPANISAGETHSYTLDAQFDFADPAALGHTLQQLLSRDDIVVASSRGRGRLELDKYVQNLTTGGGVSRQNSAAPAEVLRYTLRYSNNGTGDLTTLLIYDATPAYTALDSTVQCPVSLPTGITGCQVSRPAGGVNQAGYSGSIAWELLGTLGAGDGGEVSFDVLVE